MHFKNLPYENEQQSPYISKQPFRIFMKIAYKEWKQIELKIKVNL